MGYSTVFGLPYMGCNFLKFAKKAILHADPASTQGEEADQI